jgi:hypothetical protein
MYVQCVYIYILYYIIRNVITITCFNNASILCTGKGIRFALEFFTNVLFMFILNCYISMVALQEFECLHLSIGII